MSRTKCIYNWHETGRQVFYDGVTFETLKAMFPVVYHDDFLGAGKVVVPAAGSAESGMDWVKKIVGAGPPTVAGAANAASGVVQCALTVDDQEQEALLYHDDQRNFDVSKGLIFEARVKVSVLPTLLAEAVFGLAVAYVKGPDNPAYRIYFTADGSGELFCESDDNATPLSVTSGVTLLATDWAILRIDMTAVTGLKFFINGARVAAATTFPYAATGANAILQPYIGLYKSGGAGLGTVQVDYVKMWQNRT